MRTAEETKHLILTKGLATEESLVRRPLTEAELRQMPGPVYGWHLQNNAENVEKAFNFINAKLLLSAAISQRRVLSLNR